MPDPRAAVQAMLAKVEDVDPTDEQTKALVRRVVAAHAVGDTIDDMANDAAQIMMMLGIYPGQEADERAPDIMDLGAR